MKRERAPQGGFTLVELMIALLLFSFAVAGILSVAVTTTRSFREQRRIIATEQAVRAPLDFIVDALRQASPGVPTGTIRDSETCAVGAITVVDNTNAPDELEIVYAAGGIVSTAHSAATGSSTSVTLPAVHATQFAAGDYVLVTDSTNGTLVKVTGTTTNSLIINPTSCASAVDPFPTGGYADRALLVRAQRARFTIAQLDGIPTLWMDPDGSLGAAEAEPVAEGVEDLQVALGIDIDGDGAVGSTEWYGDEATDVLPGGTLTIRAVRVVLVARDTKELLGQPTFYEVEALNHTASNTADKYRRRVLTSTVEIRNLLGSP